MDGVLRKSDTPFIVLWSSKIKCVDGSKRLHNTYFVLGINLINSYFCNDIEWLWEYFSQKKYLPKNQIMSFVKFWKLISIKNRPSLYFPVLKTMQLSKCTNVMSQILWLWSTTEITRKHSSSMHTTHLPTVLGFNCHQMSALGILKFEQVTGLGHQKSLTGKSLYSVVLWIITNGHMGLSSSWTERQIETTENITFPQLRWRVVITIKY